MNESEYLLQSFGFSGNSLQDGIAIQVIKDAALKIKQLSQDGHNTCLTDIANRLLPAIEDDKFSSIWLVLLDGLSTLCHLEDVQAVFSRFNEKQAKIVSSGSLPVQILHKLWLCHLPCLEFAVLTLVEHICCNHHFPFAAIIRDTLMKSCVAEIASKETLIYHTVYRMLISITVNSEYATVMTDITSEFCHMVRNMTSELDLWNQMRDSSALSGNISQLETVLRSNPDPETMPSYFILNTFHKMYKIWKNIETERARANLQLSTEHSSSLNTSSQDVPEQQFEDLWCVTIQYRSWMFAALNNILLCDHQHVESCLWYITAHHQMNLCSETLKTLQIDLQNFTNGLRSLLHTSCLYSELASLLTSLAVQTQLALESKISQFKEKEDKQRRVIVFSRSVISQLLMTFFFQSDGGFTIGDDIAAFITSSNDVGDHSRCFIYHYHMLNVTAEKWNPFRCDQFQSFVSGLCLKLENEHKVKEVPDFMYIHSELKLLLPDFK